MRPLIVLLCIGLVGCSFAEKDLSVNASDKSVHRHLGKPNVIIGDRHYWCRSGEHGMKQLLMARFHKGLLIEAMQNRFEYMGECQDLITAWSWRFKLADEAGMSERW